MVVIIFNSAFEEIGSVVPRELDVQISAADPADNWAVLTTDSADVRGVYIPGTEFGGLLEKRREWSSSTLTRYEGFTWRGLLGKKVLEPAAGADYYETAAGDANTVLAELIGSRFDGRIIASSEAAGITIPAHQYSRYCTLFEAIGELCTENGLRLELTAERSSNRVTCTASLKQAETLEVLYGADDRCEMLWTDDGTGINHLICLGRGELRERTVLHLYADSSGNISTTQTLTGLAERTAVYDYGAIEDDADLEKEGRKYFRRLLNSKSLDVTQVPEGYCVGDNVRAVREGFDATAPIVGVVLKYIKGVYSVEYSIKEAE